MGKNVELPINIGDFETIREKQYYYVDKTDILETIVFSSFTDT